MEEWKEYKIGDTSIMLIDGDRGKNYPSPNEFITNGYCLFLNAGNVTKDGFSFENNAFITKEKDCLLRNGKIQRGDIVLTTRGTVGNVALYDNSVLYEHVRINSGMLIVRGGDEFNSDFLYYYIKSEFFQNQIHQMKTGSAQPQLPKSTVNNMIIRYPNSIPTQQKIANILSSLDDKIEVNRRINEELEELAQALFKSWFVDFEPFKDSEFVESELGMIPKGWKVGKLGDVADVVMGASPVGSSYNTEGNGSIFYQGRTDFGFRFPNIRMYTTEPKRFAESNSVLLSVRAPVGDVNIAFDKCCIGRGLASIKSNCNADSFTYYLLKSLRPVLDNYNNEGTVFGCINKDALNNLSIIVPLDDAIKKYEKIVSSFDEEIRRGSEEILHLTTLRDTLLPKLMSGEIAVDEVE